MLILYINIFIALFFYLSNYKSRYLFVLSAISILVINLTFGYIKINSLSKNKDSKYSVMIIQGNYPRESKFSSTPSEILDKYLNLAYKHVNKSADLILFPETAMHSDVYTVSELKSKLSTLSNDFNAQLIFGTQYSKSDKYYNASIAISPDTKTDDEIYLKRILVPFGEYNPFKLNSTQFTSTNFSAGDDCTLISSPNGYIGSAICFESVFSQAVSECVRNGANVITVLINDSWLGKEVALYQHHSHSIMRAVENNRYVLTSTNTGISSIINEYGKIIKKSKLNIEEVVNGNFYMNYDLTFYTKYGDVIIFPACFIIIYSCIKFIFKGLLKKT